MHFDPEPDATDQTPAALLGRYADRLADALESLSQREIEAAGIDEAVVAAIEAGEVADITLTRAAAVLAALPEEPAADAIAAEARDDLLLGMTTAVLDVDALAARIDLDLGPRAVQQRVEGRTRMTLAEYAHLRAAIEAAG
jgi:hypothetical protein